MNPERSPFSISVFAVLRALCVLCVLCGESFSSSALAAPPRQAERVYDLELDDDLDFDGWPDHWRRIQDPDRRLYPFLEYTPRIDKQTAVPGSAGSLRFPLYGGNHLVESHVQAPGEFPDDDRGTRRAFPVDPQVPLLLTAWVRTQGLAHGSAYAALLFLDEAGKIVQRVRSEPVHGDADWTRLEVRVDDLPARAAQGVVELWVQTELEDHQGVVWFDRVRLAETARVLLEPEQDVFSANRGIRLRVRTAGVGPGVVTARMSVTDLWGRPAPMRVLDQEDAPVDFADVRLEVGDEEPYHGTFSLRPEEPGYYRLRLEPAGGIEGDAVALAAQSQGRRSSASLGVLLDPQAAPPELLEHYGGHSGAGLAKVPIFRPGDELPPWASGDELAHLLETLRPAGMDFVGVLSPLPQALNTRLEAVGLAGQADFPFLLPADLVSPYLDPVLARHSTQIGWWQVTPETGAAVSDPGLAAARKRIVQAVPWGRVGVSLPLGAPPVTGADFVSRRVEAGAPSERIEEALGASGPDEEQWVTLELRPGGGLDDDPLAGPMPDLVAKLVAARAAGLDKVIVDPLIGKDRGLVLWDGRRAVVTPAYVAFGHVSALLAGAEFLREIPNPRTGRPDGHIYVFDGKSPVAVVWGLSEPLAVSFFGAAAQAHDVMGRSLNSRDTGAAATGTDSMPVFYTGVDWPLVSTLVDLGFEDDPLESQLTPQTRALRITNYLPDAADFSGTLRFPTEWALQTPAGGRFHLHLAAGETGRVPFTLSLPRGAFLGNNPIGVELTVAGAGRDQSFQLQRDLVLASNLGLTVRRQSDHLDVEVANGESKPVNLVLHWRLPGDTPRQYVLKAMAPGATRQLSIALPPGGVRGTAHLGLRDGEKFVNARVELE